MGWYVLLWLLLGHAKAQLTQLLSDCLFLRGEGRCEDLVQRGYALPGELDVAFKLCPGSEILQAHNSFPVAVKLSLSHDGMYFAHVGHLRPGWSSWQFRANYVRVEWTKIKELQTQAPRGTLAFFGQPCGDGNLTLPKGQWHLPRVVARPKGCFSTALSERCCHPLRPQCWGHNALLAFACCAVPYKQAGLSTCLVSNAKFPNANQDCRGHPLNFFRSFQDGNELRLVVGGRLSQQPFQAINASLSTGCLFQSILYLFHELHHLSRDAQFLEAISPLQLYSYARLFQEMMFACDLEEVQFFELAGLLPTQMLYLVWLTTGRRYDWLLDTVPRPPRLLIIDIGTAGGLDTALYLALGADVVSVEANPLASNCTSSRLTRHLRSRKLRLLNAKISTGVGREVFLGSSHALDFERAGETELPRYDANRYENRVHLHTTSCGDLVATYGTPFYMKVDVEDRIHF
ncbi:unnamed protein product [Durusdinium trenchii]|uniref:Uncharacterized protein n=1 Tax=Durusdinium trenchii TaxID=1381693 RepID=A0ABP0STN2_9DINO